MTPPGRPGAEPAWLAGASRVTRGVNAVFLAVSGGLAAAIMLVILQDVVRRYAFNDPSAWVLDICSFMLVYLFFLALAPALEAGSHVSVDLFRQLVPPRLRRGVVVLGCTLTVAFGAILWIMLLNDTIEAFADNNPFPASTIPMKMKYIWVVGPIGVAQFVLTALVLLAAGIREAGD